MTVELAEQDIFDLVVIGGGINGAGIARDASGRGLKVLLCEKDDFAGHTSSASTKLIHGGLRYLENYHFGLVKHSLREREILLKNSPHIIWPLRFVLPHDRSLRSKWLIRTGLFIYDSLAPMHRLEKSSQVKLQQHAAGEALKSQYQHGFAYSDCWVQDSRLVILNVVAAEAFGACVLNRTRCTDLKREENYWWVTLDRHGDRSMLNGVCRIRARAVVNATGAWVGSMARDFHQNDSQQQVQLIRGSHIVVQKLFDHPYAFLFQTMDRRVVFCIPYERDFTLIGTTEMSWDRSNDQGEISDAEIEYLCQAVNRYLETTVHPDDVVWTFSGVRTLCGDDGTQVSRLSRDYTLRHDDSLAPIVSVFGGKITTYRLLAEDVLEHFRTLEGFNRPKWTHDGLLPGGDIGSNDVREYASLLSTQYSWITPDLASHYACHYGTNAHCILKNSAKFGDLGKEFSSNFFQAEVDYLIEHEYASFAEDIIWRRTRHGIRMSPDQISDLRRYMDSVLDFSGNSRVALNAGICS
ncbi:MAG: glycerol-3-phosphate dehydrogenase [Gammaproteobacteria bacterium]|nr:glycerol-3-phosphate dehydrogenase [Gammaproteobacteria bacterium]